MRVLGLQFGHDAGISVIEDGRVVFMAHAERILRVKKATGLSYSTIANALARVGLRASDIDHCAIVSTQGIDIVLDDRQPLNIEVRRHPRDKIRSNLEDAARAQNVSDARILLHPESLLPAAKQRLDKRVGGIIRDFRIPENHARVVPSLNRSILDQASPIAHPAPLRALSEGLPSDRKLYEAARFDFHYPAVVTLDGHEIPAQFVGHHAAHAAATYYQSPYDSSAVMTLDGGSNWHEGGLFWLGESHRIIPLRCHYLDLGALYLWTAHQALRLGGSAEGKMMGLAPYGEPTLFDEKLIGGIIDRIDGQLIRDIWVSGIQKWSEGKHVGDPAHMTTPDNANIAASIQKLFEETMLVAIGQLELILERVGATTRSLSLSGGCMLNCPTNSRIWRESKFKDIHVEPACDDGGLPAGAALWVYHNLLDLPRAPSHPLEQGVPYLGLPLQAADIGSAVAEFKDLITVKTEGDLPAACARRLAAGEVVGWFEGRSEIGPRALGHRSIVADPRQKETWARVNTIKGRELWRPLAPSVLEEHAGEWFKGLPERSPFMMFVGEIMRDDVPAIAHIDGTARVQTVSKHCGGYYDLISRFYELTGCAVVLNTSMNGPGEPIAEYPQDAIQMLIAGRFDALAIGNMILERKH